MELIVSKVHVRNLTRAERFLKELTDDTPVKYAYVKFNRDRNTGFIVIFGEKRFVDYIIECLKSKGFLTGNTSHCESKYYA